MVAPVSTDWLSLGPAARRLGVDIDTVRRWVDSGRIEAYTTPGGHRRVSRRSVERLVRSRRSRSARLATLGVTPERLSAAYRRETRSRSTTPASVDAGLDAPGREALREHGRRLVEALLRTLDERRPAHRQAALSEVAAVAASLGQRLAAGGVALVDAVPRFVAARGPILDELGRIVRQRGLDAERTVALFSDGSAILDDALLAFVGAWSGPRPGEARR